MRKWIFVVVCVILMLIMGTSIYAEDVSVTEDGFTFRVIENTVILTGYNGTATEVVIPEMIEGMPVTRIESSAFSWNESITSVDIPNTVTEIGSRAFIGCSKLEMVEISENLTMMDTYVFYNCDALKDIVIPEKFTEIPDYAFGHCDSLIEITIPSSIKSIGKYAFCWCLNLKNVIIEDGVESVGESAFQFCENLEKVTIPSSVTSMDARIFSDCNKLKTVGAIGGGYDIEFGWIEMIPAYAFATSEIEKITIPEGVTTIGFRAFLWCENLFDITIPASVIEVGLTEYGDNGRIFGGNSKLQTAGSLDSDCNIRFGWTKEIPSYAFGGLSDLESVYLPDMMEIIGNKTFEGCSALNQITLPNALTKIGQEAFADCTSLKRIDIPASVHTIEYEAFGGSTSLEVAYFYGDIPRDAIGAILGYTSDEFTIYYPKNNTSGWTTPQTQFGWKTYPAVPFSPPCLLPLESSGYTIEDSLLKNVSPETTLAALTAQFAPEIGEVKVYTKSGAEVTDENICIGTGCEIRLMLDNLVVSTLTIIVPGDIDGNGKMEQTDADVLVRLYAGWDCSDEIAHSLAADVDGDGAATRRDAMILARRLAGWEP